MKRLCSLLLALALALALGGCAAKTGPAPVPASSTAAPAASVSGGGPGQALPQPEAAGAYYDLENVVRYLDAYGELPPNYITKADARALGWQGGPVDRFQEGAAIGGDHFGNREGQLPTAKGRRYTECDLDTLGGDSRGAKRLIFSSDGLYFYTEDHYETFTQVRINEEGEVEFLP